MHMEGSVHGAQTDLKSVASRKAEGSIPLSSALRRCSSTVECHFAKVEVAGAAPAIGSKL